jgi:hypothetical protein
VRKLLLSAAFLLASSFAGAETTKTVFSPFSGKLDFITKVTSSTIGADAGLSPSKCVETDSNGALKSAASACGSGSGSSSALQITRSGVEITSPTSSINLYSGDFLGTAIGTTAYIFLNPSTTNYVRNTSTLQSGATFYVSSGTATRFTASTITVNDLSMPSASTSGGNLYSAGTRSMSLQTDNVYIGSNAGDLTQPGGLNVCIGNLACNDINGATTSSIAIGDHALSNMVALGSMDNNIAIGSYALGSAGSHSNVAIGQAAMQLTNGAIGELVCVGYLCLTVNSTGLRNACVGGESCKSSTTGNDLTAMGMLSLSSNIEGSRNTAIGSYSLNVSTETSDNTAIGFASGGWDQGSAIAAVHTSRSTFLGSLATVVSSSSYYGNSAAIGYNARVGCSSCTVIGDTSVPMFVGIGTTTPVYNLAVVGSKGIYTDYGLTVGSMSGAGLSTCGDATHGLGWSSTDNKFTCQSITGSGGSGASTLAVTTGTSAGFFSNAISSPTAVINFNNALFRASVPAGTTAFITLETSSVTLLGPSIDLTELPAGVGLLDSTQTWSGGNTYTGSTTRTSTTTINNASTNNAIKINQTGNIGASSSVGGAINLTNTSNTGAALVAYTNQADPSDNLVNLRADNPSFDQALMFVDFRGGQTPAIVSAVTIRSSVSANGYALNIIGQSTATSTMQLSGSEAAVSSFKITHTSPTIVPGLADTNASALSIALAGVGTAAQGIFIDATATGGTTGKLMNVRNDGEEFFTLTAARNAVAKYGVFAGTITSPGFMVTTTSASVMGNAGLKVVYNVDAGSMTGAGLSTCGDATHGLGWSSTDNKFTCQSITGSGGGGGGSTLAVGTGTTAGFAGTITSSPTAVVLFDQAQFNAVLQGGATAFIVIGSSPTPISNSFTFGSTSTVVLANCGSACTVTLPTAAGISGRVYTVKIVGTGATSITTTASQTIDGSTTVTPLPNQYASLDFISDGTNWGIK